MPMSYSEAKNIVLYQCGGKLSDWHQIVGAMFESTNGFTKHGKWAICIHGSMYRIEWDNHEWNVEEIGGFLT